MKVTQWFSAEIKPMRKGTYEVQNSMFKARFLLCGYRRYFDGKNWLYWEDAAKSGFGEFPGDQWRGLAEKPKS